MYSGTVHLLMPARESLTCGTDWNALPAPLGVCKVVGDSPAGTLQSHMQTCVFSMTLSVSLSSTLESLLLARTPRATTILFLFSKHKVWLLIWSCIKIGNKNKQTKYWCAKMCHVVIHLLIELRNCNFFCSFCFSLWLLYSLELLIDLSFLQTISETCPFLSRGTKSSEYFSRAQGSRG